MRPSSSSDPNAPYRAAIASLVDCNFFADEQAELPDIAYTARQHSPFAELSPTTPFLSNDTSPIANAGQSSASHVTIDTMKNYLRAKGYRCTQMMDTTLIDRLNSANLRVETLFAAIKTVHNADHPLLATLNVNVSERYDLINRLVVIASASYGYHSRIKAAIENNNNDPEQLIANILNYVRSLKR